MPCPLISITCDNEMPSIVYQDDESDGKITEEDESAAERGEIAAGDSTDSFDPFERIATPPREYAEAAIDYKHSLLARPLALHTNVFDNIPYIDQTDDANFTESSECVEGERRECKRCDKGDCDGNSNFRDSQKCVATADRRRAATSQESDFEFDACCDVKCSSTDASPLTNELVVKDATIAPGFVTESPSNDSLRLGSLNTGAKRTLNIDEQDKLDDISNSDYADESSSTIYDDDGSNRDAGEEISTSKMYTAMPELHLDLSGLNSDISSDESKTEKCWKSPEEVRLGCGRVAALAKHFSKLGDAGLIKFKTTKLTDFRQFVSEPNITASETSGVPSRAQKGCKSDSDLAREANGNVQIGENGDLISTSVETDDDLAIEECRFHRCGAKRVTVSGTSSLNEERVDARKNSVPTTDDEDCDANESRLAGDCKSTPVERVGKMEDSSRLSLKQQQVIAQQLEQFSNLDDTDAPLFIPEQSAKRASSVSLKSETDGGASAFGDSTRSNLTDQAATASRERLPSSSDGRTRQQASSPPLSSSLPSVHFPSSSVALSLSNVKNSLSAEDKSQVYRYVSEKYPNSRLFLDISYSSAKSCSDDNLKSLALPSRANVHLRSQDDKFDTLRVQIARPLCRSENNLIGAAICEREEACHGGSHAKLTRNCKNTPSCKRLSADEMELSENPCQEIDSSRDGAKNAKLEGKARSYHRSLEELKLNKRGISSASSASTRIVQVPKRFDDKLDSENKRGTRWNRHRSFEVLKSRRELSEQHSRMNPAAELPREKSRAKRVSHDWPRGSALELSRGSETEDEERQRWRTKRKSRSELDISKRKPDLERNDWSFREISSLNDQSASRPRRMSERDLSSRLGYDATPQQIHSSKSVPALHNMGTEVKQQHEVFNPGYSRASSSNSVTPPVQPPPMATINSATALRSRSSHNLHDPMRAGALPPTGLVSRQQSSPNLNPNVTHANVPLNAQNTEVERFYQNLSIYRNQEAALKQQLSPQQSDDRNLQHNQNQKNTLRGSQNSLNRPSTLEATNYIRDRPTSAYVTQGQQQSYSAVGSQMQQQNVGPSSRSQSTRDIIRQEAKMQEMQEEVRRRELRGGAPMLGQHRPPMYNVGARGVAPATQQAPPNALSVALPKPSLGSTSNLGVASGYAARQNAPGYNYTDIQHVQHNNAQYNQYGQYNQYPNRYPVSGGQYGSMLLKPKNEAVIRGHQSMPHESPLGKDQHNQQEAKASAEQSRHFAGSQNSPHYPNGSLEQRVDQYTNDGMINRAQNGESNPAATSEVPPTRPTLPSEEFNESPPPPPPDTSTHPLYNKQADMRYMASMQDPPRGSYYPAGGISAMQQPRQYQYSATNPWQREEREKEQARRREAARQWRDQQIAELSALTHRTQQQEEQLRALQLERDFQKRAEEAANQDDDEESNDLDNESTQRIQDLFRMAASQERTIQGTQQPPILSRTNVGNQSIRGGLSLQLVGNQPVISGHTHILSGQAATQNVGASGADQEGGDLHVQSSHQQQQQQQQQQRMPANQSEEQMHMPTNYGTPLGSHFSSGQKSYSMGMLHSIEDKELQRKMDETKRKQADLEESQKKQEEHQLHSQQQAYQQSQHARSQQSLHPSMLRLDNLIINGSNVPMPLQHNINDAPPPPERGSSYAVMSQQNALRSNSSIASNLPPASQQPPSLKRVSFHDSNANSEPTLRNVSSATPNPPSFSMNTIREDPNNFINDAENLLASPKTPEGSGTSFSGATPGVIGAQEVYKDPRQKRLAEKQKQQNLQIGAVPEKLSFKEKMKMFAMETGEDGTPRDKVKISRAQREIDNISSPLNSNNNNNNINNISGNNNTNSNRT
nr:PREDICTED: uncharacterized protein LOC105671319 isoform X7 [Linepithema humile]